MNIAAKLRSIILEQSKRAGVGHIGSALSIVPILEWLYPRLWTSGPEKDCVVMSKGHAALAWYAFNFLLGNIDKDTLNTYCADNTLLGVHPDHNHPMNDFSTGSLGMGVTFAVGDAFAAKKAGINRRTYCIISDAELNEGSTWEALFFARQHELKNFCLIVDNNRQQALGASCDILAIKPIEMLNAVGFDCYDGLPNVPNKSKWKPMAIVAFTISGDGVDFMERKVDWHYLPMTNKQYEIAKEQVTKKQ